MPVPVLVFRINEEVIIVELLMASLNVAVIEVVTATPVAPPVGVGPGNGRSSGIRSSCSKWPDLV